MSVKESGMDCVFSKALGLSYKHGSFTEFVLQSVFGEASGLF